MIKKILIMLIIAVLWMIIRLLCILPLSIDTLVHVDDSPTGHCAFASGPDRQIVFVVPPELLFSHGDYWGVGRTSV